jgi:hypothetical protein
MTIVQPVFDLLEKSYGLGAKISINGKWKSKGNQSL